MLIQKSVAFNFRLKSIMFRNESVMYFLYFLLKYNHLFQFGVFSFMHYEVFMVIGNNKRGGGGGQLYLIKKKKNINNIFILKSTIFFVFRKEEEENDKTKLCAPQHSLSKVHIFVLVS